MKPGIRSSVLLLAVVPATLIAVVLVAYLTNTRVLDLERSLMDRGRAIANQLAPACEYGVIAGNRDILSRLAGSVLQEADVSGVTIKDRRGRVLVRAFKPRLFGPREPAWADWIPLPTRPPLQFSAPIHRTDIDIGDAFDPLAAREHGPPAGPQVIGQVRVEISREATQRRQREVIMTSLLLTLSCLLVVLFLGLAIGRKVSQPILELDNTVRELRDGRLEARVKTRSFGELGSLEQGVNAMAAALEASRRHLQEQVDVATAELRETLEELEIKNVELDIARKKALQASRVKSEFLANMSHEIRTPMNGLLGFLELLAKTDLNRSQQGYLSTIRTSAENLLVILNDILDFSKIEAGKLQLRKRPFDLREVLENAVLLFAANAQHKGVQLLLDIEPDLPCQLLGDGQRLAQVVTNLVSNAIKATDQGEVEVRAARLEERADSVTVGLQVRDTGAGIAPADQQRVFDAFNQLDASTTRRHSGTGLGLAICHRLVSLMGGEIHIDSQLGTGSTFHVVLPLARQRPVPAAKPPPAARQVLVISDNAALSRALAHILTFAGIGHRRGEIAVLPWLAAPPDAVILDCSRQDLAEHPFVATVRRHPPPRPCSLIVLGAGEDHPQLRPLAELFTIIYFANLPPTARELLPLLGGGP
ncbi:MAG: ATP-binding protein, partial [Pseudomonadota bacterium]|nr:ATP-binding protein [Pseudomonadota bacterium]